MGKVLHLNFREGADWILRLQSHLNGSAAVELRQRVEKWEKLNLGEKALAITAKTTAVHISGGRLNGSIYALDKELKENYVEVIDCLREGCAYNPKRSRLAYEVLTDVDAFLFETRSAYEITVKFVAGFLSDILDRTTPNQKQKKALYAWFEEQLSRRGADLNWAKQLGLNRNTFTHETAPWPALEIISTDPLKWNLVLLKRNVADLGQPNTHLHLDECSGIFSGFTALSPILERWLTDEIRSFEARQPPPGRFAAGKT